jgi:hypothetical protein
VAENEIKNKGRCKLMKLETTTTGPKDVMLGIYNACSYAPLGEDPRLGVTSTTKKPYFVKYAGLPMDDK